MMNDNQPLFADAHAVAALNGLSPCSDPAVAW